MSRDNVATINPTQVQYKGHTIRMTYRPRTNDWEYIVRVQRTVTLRNRSANYNTALAHAKKDIDAIT